MTEQRSGFTQGPWYDEVVRTEQGYGLQIQGNRTGISSVVVADLPISFVTRPVDGQHATWDAQRANARAIKEVPALVALLKTYVTAFGHDHIKGHSGTDCFHCEARSVLARITGAS